MYYSSTSKTQNGINGVTKLQHKRSIDLRSDTLTHPTQKMREAIYKTEVGDDVYGEDEPTNAMQAYAAALCGKEASMLVPTGTMSNLISVWTHCNTRASGCIIGHKSHIAENEQGGVATIANVYPCVVQNLPDGRLNLDEVERSIHQASDIYKPAIKLICLENTHNFCGGKVIPMDHAYQLRAIADKHGLKLHLDGARVFNAATALNLPVSEVVKPFDSVNICLSKGLAAPIGSLVIGTKEFVSQALHLRKALGGGMRQTGIVSAAGLIGLKEMSQRLYQDHEVAQVFAKGLAGFKNYGLICNKEEVETNIIIFTLPNINAQEFADYLQNESDVAVKLMAIDGHSIRLVTHHHITMDDAKCALDMIEAALIHFKKS